MLSKFILNLKNIFLKKNFRKKNEDKLSNMFVSKKKKKHEECYHTSHKFVVVDHFLLLSLDSKSSLTSSLIVKNKLWWACKVV